MTNKFILFQKFTLLRLRREKRREKMKERIAARKSFVLLRFFPLYLFLLNKCSLIVCCRTPSFFLCAVTNVKFFQIKCRQFLKCWLNSCQIRSNVGSVLTDNFYISLICRNISVQSLFSSLKQTANRVNQNNF